MNAQAHIHDEAATGADTLLPRLADDASVRELMRPFAGLLDDSSVTELVINRPQRVLTETHLGWQPHDCADLDFERLMSFAVAVATLTNQEVSARHPILSALLPGDARIQIVVPPVVPPRTVSITIRRPSRATKEPLMRTAAKASLGKPYGVARMSSTRRARRCGLRLTGSFTTWRRGIGARSSTWR